MNWLKNEDVYKNFIALFLAEYKVYDSQYVGIWEKTNLPVIIREEMLANFCIRYELIKVLTFEEARHLAKTNVGATSKLAQQFLEINEHNWEHLFKCALKSVDDKYSTLDRKYWYNFLANQDTRYYTAHKD